MELKDYKGMLYDPPSGWRYGFPKQYLPLEGESLEDTLRRDGYPESELAQGMADHCRFIGTIPSCHECGAEGFHKMSCSRGYSCPRCHAN